MFGFRRVPCAALLVLATVFCWSWPSNATAAPTEVGEEFVPISSPEARALLNLADSLLEASQTDSAVAVYKRIVVEYDSTFTAARALQRLFNVYVNSETPIGVVEAYYRSISGDFSLSTYVRNVAEQVLANAFAWYGDERAVAAHFEVATDTTREVWERCTAWLHIVRFAESVRTVNVGLIDWAIYNIYLLSPQEPGQVTWAIVEVEYPDRIQYVVSHLDYFAQKAVDVAFSPESAARDLNAYPNPFNPAVTIRYAMAESGVARLSVLNLAGQTVNTLINEFRSVGPHTAIWDGTDFHGRQVAAGVYLVRFSDGRGDIIRRVTLVR